MKIISILKKTKDATVGFCRWYRGLYRGKKWYTKLGIGFVSFIVSIFLWLGAVDINLFWLFGSSPGFINGGLDLKPSQSSEIYTSDGKLIGKYYSENRSPVVYDEVNPMFWKALIDTEDERFYKHWGVDPIGIVGAMKDAALGHGGRGASTITQQLAKNLFNTRGEYSRGLIGRIPGIKLLVQKSKEWIIASKLEVKYPKDNILVMYANTVDFGNNAYGLKTAAKTYFNKTPKELKVEECALLVGLLKATTTYNPVSNPKNALARRNQVLENMCSHGDLSRKECDKLKAKPIDLHFNTENPNDGQAHYFRNAILEDPSIKAWKEENGVDFYSAGLKIYTTVDSRLQKYAEAAVKKQMRQVQQNFNSHWSGQNPWRDENGNEIPGFIEGIVQKLPLYKSLCARYQNNMDSVKAELNRVHKVKLFDYDKGTIERQMSTMDSIRYMVKFMHCSFVAIDPQTGDVKAWVGDVDYAHWQYDKVTAERQPGSTFKLFVYTAAMDQGLTPCDERRDESQGMWVYDKQQKKDVWWNPSNANGRFTGDSIPLKSAFARSINSIAVRLGQEVGIPNVVQMAEKMGIKSPLDATPSLALGSSDVNLLEMVSAYATVADNGMHHEPVLVTKIVDSDGEVVYDVDGGDGPESRQALKVKTAFLTQQLLLAGSHEPGGTSQAMHSYIGDVSDLDYGGKTGTSNNHSDAWFMCVTPKLVCGAWVGGEYRCIHFRTGALGQGSRTALPICGYFMQSVMHDSKFRGLHARFSRPDDPDILNSMYRCDAYVENRIDTTLVDSLMIDETLPAEEDAFDVTDELGEPAPADPSVNKANAAAATGTSGGAPKPANTPTTGAPKPAAPAPARPATPAKPATPASQPKAAAARQGVVK